MEAVRRGGGGGWWPRQRKTAGARTHYLPGSVNGGQSPVAPAASGDEGGNAIVLTLWPCVHHALPDGVAASSFWNLPLFLFLGSVWRRHVVQLHGTPPASVVLLPWCRVGPGFLWSPWRVAWSTGPGHTSASIHPLGLRAQSLAHRGPSGAPCLGPGDGSLRTAGFPAS